MIRKRKLAQKGDVRCKQQNFESWHDRKLSDNFDKSEEVYDCMLADTRSLDMQLAQSCYPGDADFSPDFSALARIYFDIRQKELELNDVSGTINDTLNQLTYNAIHLCICSK